MRSPDFPEVCGNEVDDDCSAEPSCGVVGEVSFTTADSTILATGVQWAQGFQISAPVPYRRESTT